MSNKKTLGIRLSVSKKRKGDSSDYSVEPQITATSRIGPTRFHRRTHRASQLPLPGPSNPKSPLVDFPIVNEPPLKKRKTDLNSTGEPASCRPPKDSGFFSFLVPGYNYLGPGNPIDNGPPTNKIDEVARKHDLDYDEAERTFASTGNIEQAFENIHKADKEFLRSVSELEPGTYSEFFGKYIGQAGIGIKSQVEGILHSTLYPKFESDVAMDNDSVDGVDLPNNAIAPSNIKGVFNIGNGVQQNGNVIDKHYCRYWEK